MTTRNYIIENPPNGEKSLMDYFRRIAQERGENVEGVKAVYYRLVRSCPGLLIKWLGEDKEEQETKDKTTWDIKSDGAQYQYEGYRNFRTLDEALEYCEVDLNIWEVERHVFNAWDVTMKGKDGEPIKRTNYQIKIWFKKRVEETSIDDFIEILKQRSRPFVVKKTKGSDVGVFKLSDFHMGAYVGDLVKSPDFNFNVLTGYIQEIAEYINSRNYKEVYISLLGDFIESFTGLNHKNSWKGLERSAHGVKAVKMAHNMLRDNLYTKVNNLKWVGFVSGNHDRVTEKTEGDESGGAAEAMQWAFEMEVDIESEWNPIIISKVIDGISYVDTHGHLGIVKKDIAQIIFDYGSQDHYNVFCKGHLHSREMKKRYKKQLLQYENVDVINYDQANFRAVTVPPLFTGNFYSESNGWTSTAGFAEFWNNGKGKPNYFDASL